MADSPVSDPALAQALRVVWAGPASQGGLVGELWVEGMFGAKASDDTLASLVDRHLFDGWLAKHLDRTGAVPLKRALYTHQRDAILAARAQRNMRDLRSSSRRPRARARQRAFYSRCSIGLFCRGRGGSGMRTLLLYPMNALVNDQVTRLATWLDAQNRLSFFHFTSETPETAADAAKAALAPRCAAHVLTRAAARSGSARPDIVVTNYSMLEYMLWRPQDACFFDGALDVVVLDEAHLYQGTLAAEITLLLRRVFQRCGKRPADVLVLGTSATLGHGSTAEIADQLSIFGAALTSREPSDVRAIQGVAAPRSFDARPRQANEQQIFLDAELASTRTLAQRLDGTTILECDAERAARIANVLVPVAGRLDPVPEEPAKVLAALLPRIDAARRLYESLWEKPSTLDALRGVVGR